jgi:hypothetical protein
MVWVDCGSRRMCGAALPAGLTTGSVVARGTAQCRLLGGRPKPAPDAKRLKIAKSTHMEGRGFKMKLPRISISIVSVVIALTLSAASAGAFEFHNEARFVTIDPTSYTQTFDVGSSNHVACKKLELEPQTATEKTTKLTLAIVKYGECKYTHSGTAEAATVEAGGSGCAYALKSLHLKEVPPSGFTEGELLFECPTASEIRFTTSKCVVGIAGGQGPLLEYTWENLDITAGHYMSEADFRLKAIEYVISGTGCGSSGSNGEYVGAVVLSEIIVEE